MNWLAYISVCSLLPDTLPPPTVSCLGEIVVYPFWKDLKYLYLTSSFCSFSLISFLYSIFNEHKPNSSICPLPIGSGLPLAPFPLSPAFVGMRFSGSEKSHCALSPDHWARACPAVVGLDGLEPSTSVTTLALFLIQARVSACRRGYPMSHIRCWSVWMDSNHRPRAYQARALTT